MIPVKLELHNFLAYRDPPPLDLSGLHMACLAGANGAGKSSLLDAITWALWGKARARRDDDLIHGDETEMHVRLTFALGGHLYRVMRYRSRQGRGTSTLHLEVADGEGWRPITAPSIRETQEKINAILRLDYETFINSAFLMQGRADEFTKKTPAERKAILSEILGLERWLVYEERAKERLRVLAQERSRVESEIVRIDEELGREVEYLRELGEAQQKLAALSAELRSAEAKVRELESLSRERDRLLAHYRETEQRIRRSEDDLKRLEAEWEERQQRLAHYREVAARRAEIEEGYQRLRTLRQQESELNARQFEQAALLRRHSELQQAITAERARLEAEQHQHKQRRQELVRRLSSVQERLQRLHEAEADIERLQARKAESEQWREQCNALREERAALEGTNRSLKREMEVIKAQQDQILTASEPLCPLCQQALSEMHRAELLERLSREGNQKGELYRANLSRIEALDTEIERLVRQVAEAERELRKLEPLQQHVARLGEQLKQAREEEEELGRLEARLTELAAMLEAQTYAPEVQAALAEVRAQMAALGYDEQAHHALRAQIAELEGVEVLKGELEGALQAIPEVESALQQLVERRTALEAEIAQDRAALETLATEIEALGGQVADLEAARRVLEDLRDAERQAHYLVGAAEQKINALEQQRQRRKMLLEEAERLLFEQGIYDELRAACSKDGIPAMIIEAAIPEIEEEANQLLARMTDGRMHIHFETQREKVTGGVRETLDIRIADELGTRDYETFSGGEAFRVNFAIRLALSRLLARRAGAQLRTLIVDEGFGTQDTEGRERLVQALNSIKDEFDLILVITHLDELKDAFPARLEVTKTRDGSMVEIV